MKKKLSIVFICLSLFIMAFECAYAVKSVSSLVNFMQPNGSIVQIKLYGDEFFSYKKNLAGYVVEQGIDGFLYYANYNLGVLQLSGNRVSSGVVPRMGVSSYIPQNIIMQIREQRISEKRVLTPMLKSSPSISPFVGFISQSPLIIKTPVILVEFADTKFITSTPCATFNAQLNQPQYSVNGATGSAADYFNENMRGRYSFVFDVFNKVITLDKPIAYYSGDKDGKIDINIKYLFDDVCKVAIEQGIDFSTYDWFGNGVVGDVALIYAGTSQAETGNINDIWPQYCRVDNVSFNGKKINAFTCSSELAATGILKGKSVGIGTFCHEFSHALGLPDMYDTNGENEGVGVALCSSLSIMDGGNYLNSGRTPPFFTAIEREILGDNPIVPALGETYTVLPTSKRGEMFRIDSENKGEYFLIECRNLKGWDKYIGGEGVIVYRIDKSQALYGGLTSSLRWEYNNINCYAQHQCATVFPASTTPGVTLDYLFFPGTSKMTELNAKGPLKFTDWNGKPLQINITGISYNNEVAKFTAIQGQMYDQTLPYVKSFTVFPYQYDCKIIWEVPSWMVIGNGRWRITCNPNNEWYTTNNYIYIPNLNPGTEYNVSVVYENENKYGIDNKVKFLTHTITSSMPFICIRGEYKIGEIIDLRVFNLVEDYDRIQWYVNSKRYTDSTSYEFKEAGDFLIETKIYYKDGSQEHIRKNIKVK
ncbi:MAG: M6 family metalloprotease domain-containing protein [Bacteroidales bacterium]